MSASPFTRLWAGRIRALRKTGVAVAFLLVLIFPSAPLVYGDASHDGWPTNDCDYRTAPNRVGAREGEGPNCGVYISHAEDQHGVLRGTGRIDELLGGHGNDLIYGRGGPDVIWGDFKPCCQPLKQRDRLRGGTGNDHIYVSHGTNNVKGGPGNDRIHAHYGHTGSSVDCGSGNDKVWFSKQRRSHYSVRNCEVISYAIE